MSAVSTTMQIEFILTQFDIPKNRKSLKDKLSKYGIHLFESDKILIEDTDGDRIALDDDLYYKYQKYFHSKFVKFVIIKYEGVEKVEKVHNEMMLDLLDSSVDKIFNSIPSLDIHKFNNINYSVDNLNITESVILTPSDTCFQTIFKKYVNDFFTIINSNSERDLHLFYSYLNNENFLFYSEQFSKDEIHHAKELLVPFHNILVLLNENKNWKIGEIKHQMSKTNEELKSCEKELKETQNKFIYYKEFLDKNKALFNKFMLEIHNHVQELNFNLENDNFEQNKFEDNLSLLFSFIIKMFYDRSSNNEDKTNNISTIKLKSDKYGKYSPNFSKCTHKLCIEQNCPYKQIEKAYSNKNTINRYIYEEIYRSEKIYEV